MSLSGAMERDSLGRLASQSVEIDFLQSAQPDACLHPKWLVVQGIEPTPWFGSFSVRLSLQGHQDNRFERTAWFCRERSDSGSPQPERSSTFILCFPSFKKTCLQNFEVQVPTTIPTIPQARSTFCNAEVGWLAELVHPSFKKLFRACRGFLCGCLCS